LMLNPGSAFGVRINGWEFSVQKLWRGNMIVENKSFPVNLNVVEKVLPENRLKKVVDY